MKYAILIVLIFISCDRKETEYTYHTESGLGVYDVAHNDFDDAIRYRFYPCGCYVDSVKVIKKTPLGSESNWFSGNGVYYEIEYTIYYRKGK